MASHNSPHESGSQQSSLVGKSSHGPGLQPRSCRACNKRDSLLQCPGCQVVHYCDHEHLAVDRKRHEFNCFLIEQLRKRIEEERQQLRHMPEGSDHPGNLFETSAGRFEQIMETRLYVHFRLQLIETLLYQYGKIGGHAEAVEEALDHVMDVIYLTGRGNSDLRCYAAALPIRLRRDQEAYEFCKMWLREQREVYHNPNMQWPLLNIPKADMFESTEIWTIKLDHLTHISLVVLIKARIVLDLQTLQSAHRFLRGILPREIIDLIRSQLVTTVLDSHPELVWASTEELSTTITTVKAQVKSLYDFIEENSPYLWYFLLERGKEAVKDNPWFFVNESEEEAGCAMRHIYTTWAENPRAMELMRDLRRNVKSPFDVPLQTSMFLNPN